MAFKKSKRKIGFVLSAAILLVGVVFMLQSCGGNSADDQIKLGYKYLQEGKYEEAILAFDKAISIDAKNTEARFGKIEAYLAMGDMDSAMLILSEISELGISSKDLTERFNEFYNKIETMKNITVEDITEINDGNVIKGVRGVSDNEIIWEYKSERPGAQISQASNSYVDGNVVYICGDIDEGITSGVTAINKYTGEILWNTSTENVPLAGGCPITSDEKNVYAAACWGGKFAIIDKNGKLIYEQNEDYDEIFETGKIRVEGNTLIMEYAGHEYDGIKRIDISAYK